MARLPDRTRPPPAAPGRNEPRIDADEILEAIVEWVRIESPSHDAEAVNRMVDHVESVLRPLTSRIERTPGRDGYGDILAARSEWGGEGPGILVLSHLDTVHPVGTLDGVLNVRREGDRVYGPGIYDMKGGACLAWYAFRHLARTGRETPLPVTFLFVPEEEVGSPVSRAAIEAAARVNRYVLVTEPARDGGCVVTARKGVAIFEMTAKGRSAHAGVRHQDGRSAIREMARQILRLECLTDYERGVTVNVGVVAGGTGSNVVPAECGAKIDMRVPNAEVGDEMCALILGLMAFDPDVEVEVTGGMNRPPYEKDPGIEALFEHAQGLAAEIGFELGDVKTGGGSDGNFTAALGVPTLDGLGVDGHGAHSHEEHLYFSSLEPRARLMLRLLETLE